jgi:ADP-ribosyl-[dinitrogen reductase] hydrolase
MRVLPLALWHLGSDDELVRDAMQSSLVTHGHARSQLCCALYCLWVRRILEEVETPWHDALASLRSLVANDGAVATELEHGVRPEAAPDRAGSGYVVDTLRTVHALADRDSYERVVRGAIALGFDTDTTAAVAGGLAGVREGFQAIPARWRSSLRGRELLAPLLDRLLAHRAREVAQTARARTIF